jgi:hypothetical protein
MKNDRNHSLAHLLTMNGQIHVRFVGPTNLMMDMWAHKFNGGFEKEMSKRMMANSNPQDPL